MPGFFDGIKPHEFSALAAIHHGEPMKTLTVLIEVPDDRAEDAFHEMIETCSEQVIAADKDSLTIRLRDEADHR